MYPQPTENGVRKKAKKNKQTKNKLTRMLSRPERDGVTNKNNSCIETHRDIYYEK